MGMWRNSTSATVARAGYTSVAENHGNMPASGGCCAGGHLCGEDSVVALLTITLHSIALCTEHKNIPDWTRFRATIPSPASAQPHWHTLPWPYVVTDNVLIQRETYVVDVICNCRFYIDHSWFQVEVRTENGKPDGSTTATLVSMSERLEYQYCSGVTYGLWQCFWFYVELSG